MSASIGWRKFREAELRLLLTTVFLGAGVMKLAGSGFEVSNGERFG